MKLWQELTLNRKFCSSEFGPVWCFWHLSSRLRKNPHTEHQLHWPLFAVTLSTALLAAGKRREYSHQMSGQYFWRLQSFSCICPRCVLTIVTVVPELTQMRHIQGRSSNTLFSKPLVKLVVLLNPALPSQLGSHWPPKTSKRAGTYQSISVVIYRVTSIQNQGVLYTTSAVLPYPRPREKNYWMFNT